MQIHTPQHSYLNAGVSAVDTEPRGPTRPPHSLAIDLTAIHAAHSKDIGQLLLEDVDFGHRRLTIAGRSRPVDDLTYRAQTDWRERRAEGPPGAPPPITAPLSLSSRTRPRCHPPAPRPDIPTVRFAQHADCSHRPYA